MDATGSPEETTIAHLFNSEPAPAPAPQPATEQPLPPDVADQYPPLPLPVAAEPAVTPAPEPAAPPQQHMVPLAELIETRKRAQFAEESARREAQRADQLEAMRRQQAQPQPQVQPVIDPEVDPAGAFNALRAEMHQNLLVQNLNVSERYARDKYGDAVVDAATNAALESGYNQAFLRQADPYKATVEWYQGQQVRSEIGADPVAYRAKVEAEVRAKVLAEMRAGTPPPSNLPPSLSTATRVNNAPQVVESDKDFFKSMMNQRAR